MLVAAALVPHSALLVPGAAGATQVLDVERAAAVAAVADLLVAGPEVVVVVAAGPGEHLTGRLQPSLAAAGIDDTWLGWPARPTAGAGGVRIVRDVGASVALHLLGAAGWAGPVEVLTVPPEDGPGLRALGGDVAAGRRTGLLLAAGLSARRGPGSPIPPDERAAAVDDAVLADLVDLGAAAAGRLAAVPPDLAVSAWAPWQVLLGAVGPVGPDGPDEPRGGPAPLRGDLRLVGAPFGATYAVLVWT